jgi:Na+/melibiose symporter-like transporter
MTLVAAGIAGGMVFLRIERRVPHPMLPLAVFGNKAFTAATIGGFAFQFGFYGMMFMLALFVQIQWGVDPLHAGWMLLPSAVAVILTTMVLNPMLLHHGPRWMLWAGGAVATIGSVVLMAVSTPDTWPLFDIGTVLVGVGASVFSPSLNVVATTTIEPAYAGLASGIYNTSRQIGMAVSIAVLGALVGGGDLPGVRTGLLLIAGCFATIVALALRYIQDGGCPAPAGHDAPKRINPKNHSAP